jgi:hypothetical protein
MRNDARPIGPDAPPSPVSGEDAPEDTRDSVTHDRQSHIVNRDAGERAPRPGGRGPTMPTGESTLNTRT